MRGLHGETMLTAWDRCRATVEPRRALALLELENSGLRRLVVELIEKNQRLREEMHSHSVQAGYELRRSAL